MKIMLKLYTTSHCHLCETALELLLQQCKAEQVTPMEITENDDLMRVYGTRIPVLQRDDTLAELNWPFDVQQLGDFLST